MHRGGINSVYQKYCDKVSLADFIIIIAESVMGRLATGYNATEPFKEGTLSRAFLDQIKVGRETMEICPENVGLMPNPE